MSSGADVAAIVVISVLAHMFGVGVTAGIWNRMLGSNTLNFKNWDGMDGAMAWTLCFLFWPIILAFLFLWAVARRTLKGSNFSVRRAIGNVGRP